MSLIRPCPSCGAKNRIPGAHLADTGRCGSCKAELPPASSPIEVDPALFDEIVGSATVPILVDFWADWCGPCHAAAPHVAETAARMQGKAVVLKVDVDSHPDLAQRFQVPGFPTFLVLKGGTEAWRHLGYITATQMVAGLEGAS